MKRKILNTTAGIALVGLGAFLPVGAVTNQGAQSVMKYENGFEYYSLARDWNDEIIYQIFPIAYRDSDGDQIGDLNGITDSIPYLKQLGITAVWLNPVFKSDSYHKYDTIDYKAIDPKFGNMANFENMVKKFHDNGLKVILDYAVNHSSSYNEWFRAAIDYNHPQHNKYKDFFKIETDRNKPETKNTQKWIDISKAVEWNRSVDSSRYQGANIRSGVFYSSFGTPAMADFNLHNPAVQAAIEDIAKFWVDKGVDGFRLDATRHAYDDAEYSFGGNFIATNLNQQVWNNFTRNVANYGRSKGKNIYVVGENAFGAWYDLKQYTSSYSQLDFPFYYGFRDGVKNHQTGGIFKTFVDNLYQYRRITDTRVNAYGQTRIDGAYTVKNGNPDYMSTTFISNHDNSRIASEINGDYSSIKGMAALQMLLPGIPVIYYGDELGLLGQKNPTNDYSQRQAMPWDAHGSYLANYIPKQPDAKNVQLTHNPAYLNAAAQSRPIHLDNIYTSQLADGNSLNTFALYKKIIQFRKEHDFLANPDGIFNYDVKNDGLSAMKIDYQDKTYIVIANLTETNRQGLLYGFKDAPTQVGRNNAKSTSGVGAYDFQMLFPEFGNRFTRTSGTYYKTYGDFTFNNNRDQSNYTSQGFQLNSHSIVVVEVPIIRG